MPKNPKPYTDKERTAAVAKMHQFLTNKNSNHGWVFNERREPLFLKTKSAEELFRLMQLFYDHSFEIAALAKWANTHKRAYKEMRPEDYKAVQDLFVVSNVQES